MYPPERPRLIFLEVPERNMETIFFFFSKTAIFMEPQPVTKFFQEELVVRSKRIKINRSTTDQLNNSSTTNIYLSQIRYRHS